MNSLRDSEMNLRVLIVDDEPLARRRMAAMLGQMTGVEVVGEAEDGDVALDMIRTRSPDVVLLDIQMPGRNGLDLASSLEGPAAPLVIFVTAFNRYAVRAFEVPALDYLLKPVVFSRVREALERARIALQNRDAQGRLAEMAAVVAVLRAESDRQADDRYESEFWLPKRGEHVRLAIDRLDWVAAERDYVRLHAGNDMFLLRETMNRMEGRLDPADFIRVHRSAIVRRSLICAVRQHGFGVLRVALDNGLELPVGRSYARRVRELLPGTESLRRPPRHPESGAASDRPCG